MRLTKVAQAPSQITDDDGGGYAGEHREVTGVLNNATGGVGVFSGEAENLARVVQGEKHHDGHDDEGGEHQQALDGIGIGHRKEAADEGVEDRHGSHDEHAHHVVTAEAGLEVTAASHHAGGDVEGEEEDNDRRRDNAQQARLIVQAVLEEGGHGDRVAGNFGVGAQTRRDPLPVGPSTNEEADGHPQLGHTGQEQSAGQAHEQPAGHIGGAGG